MSGDYTVIPLQPGDGTGDDLGAVGAAFRWKTAMLVDGDFDTAWAITAPTYRRHLYELYKRTHTPACPPLAATTADMVDTDPGLRRAFAESMVTTFRTYYADWPAEGWGTVHGYRPAGLGRVTVAFAFDVPADAEAGTLVYQRSVTVPGTQVLMQWADHHWSVLNIDSTDPPPEA